MGAHYEQVHLRLTEKEKDRLRTIADASSMTMSDVVRVLIQLPSEAVSQSDELKTAVILDKSTMRKMSMEMRRWGYHYNQAVHALNSLAYYMRLDEADYMDALDALDRVDHKIDGMNVGVEMLRNDVAKLSDYYLACI